MDTKLVAKQAGMVQANYIGEFVTYQGSFVATESELETFAAIITADADKRLAEVQLEIDAAQALRAEKMPDEHAAIAQMFEAYQRLKELGWNDAIYCPKDGTMFSVIEAGSTGIHKCNYQGEWPKGTWWVYDGDMWPSRPILYRKRKDNDPEINNGLAMEYSCCDHK